MLKIILKLNLPQKLVYEQKYAQVYTKSLKHITFSNVKLQQKLIKRGIFLNQKDIAFVVWIENFILDS